MGLCNKHYQRLWKTGSALGMRPSRWDGYVKPDCQVPGCGRASHANNLCTIHAPRLRRHGDPMAGRRPNTATINPSELSRLARRLPNGCLEWTAGRSAAGYGRLGGANGDYAHRLMYELVVGKIPRGSDVHHKCLNRACIEVFHLECLTRKEHALAHRLIRARQIVRAVEEWA